MFVPKTAVPAQLSKNKSPKQLNQIKKFAIMSLLNKFAAQQLTKKEMNNVKGGKIFHCSIVFCYEVENEFGSTDFASESALIEADSLEEANRMVAAKYANSDLAKDILTTGCR